MRRAAVLLVALWPGLAWGQADPQTLADIRSQIAALSGEIEGLRGELSASGQLTTGVTGNTPLERLNAIEAELQRLTSKAEELEFRINRITTDGTNRLGDLEFRVCELEEGCDVGALGNAPSLGGVDNATVVPAPADLPADELDVVLASLVVRFAVEPDRTSAVDEPFQPSERQDSARSSMSMVPSSSRMSSTRSYCSSLTCTEIRYPPRRSPSA